MVSSTICLWSVPLNLLSNCWTIKNKGGSNKQTGNYVKFNDGGVALNPYQLYRQLLGAKYRDHLQLVYRDRSDENLTHPVILTEDEKWDYLKQRYGVRGNTDEAISLAPVVYLEQGVKLSPEA